MIELLHDDCMNIMAKYPDKYFELAIVDPPYGINASVKSCYHANAMTVYKLAKWDANIPNKNYFNELFRVSKNQIIWGGNYFTEFLPSKYKWIVWDKMQPEGIDQAMFELAWNSNNKIQAKIYRQSAQSNKNNVSNNTERARIERRFHPTQKPVKLYRWLLHNYAKPGDKILDTHLGSGSIAIACHDMGFSLVGVEIDEDYYKAACKRFKEQTAQLKLII